jgi:hypothetical protein
MHLSLAQWLERKPAGPKSKKRIPRMGKKRQGEARVYAKKRKAFLEEKPMCEAHATIIVYEEGAVGLLYGTVKAQSTDVHHCAKRGRNYLKTDTWMAVCRSCHDWIHGHPKISRDLGLLQ